MDDVRLDELMDHVRGLEERLAAQEAELEDLRARGSATGAMAAPATTTTAIGRRRLLVGGASAAAAGVAALVVTADPAAAASGDELILGEANDAEGDATTLNAAVQDDAVLTVTNDSELVVDTEPGGISAGSSFGYGVRGSSGLGNGVEGSSIFATGVSGSGSGPDAVGVAGSASSGIGVRASGLTGVDAYGSGDFDTSAIHGYAVKGVGVLGESGQTVGLMGHGGVGLVAESTDVAAILDGARTHIRFSPEFGSRGAPTADTTEHQLGDIVHDKNGVLWACIASGTPGTWRTLTSPTAAGQLNLLPTPVRVYDSRPASPPATGPKTKLVPDTPRSIDCRANASGVPAGAVAVEVTLLVVNAPVGNGNLTIWAGGATRPQANAMVWGGSAGRFSSPATSRVDSTGTVQVVASVATHLALDVVGYYI